MPNAKATLISVRTIAELDTDSDTSYLGEYTDQADDWNIHRPSGQFVIDHKREQMREQLDSAKHAILDRWKDGIADGATVEFCDDDEAIDNQQLVATIEYDDDGTAQTEEDWENLDYSLAEYSRECTYFAPYAGGEPAGTDDYRKYAKQDYKRMESLNSGNWNYVGIRCVATIDVNGEELEIESPGLWGVESDSGREYFAEIIGEQLAELRDQLTEFGFTEDEIQFPKPAELVDSLDV